MLFVVQRNDASDHDFSTVSNECGSSLAGQLRRRPAEDSVEYPLSLISPASSKLITSTLGEFNLDHLEVMLHPDNALSREIVSGDRVRVFNDLGTVECIARVDTHVRPGVVSMPKGAWRKASLNGMTSTALCPAHVNVVAGGACFNDARVEIELID